MLDNSNIADLHLKVFYSDNYTCVWTAKEYTIEAAKLLRLKGISFCLSLENWMQRVLGFQPMVFKEDSAEVNVTIMTNEERDTVNEEMIRKVDRKFKGATVDLKFTNVWLLP